jgi:xanthine dehydrogenase accessory factor
VIDAKGAAAPGGPRSDAELFAEVARRAAAREPFALCTVVATHRSAPRDAGAKMLVAPDGSICGTVGGGPLEASVLFEAVQLLRGGGESGIRRYALTTAGDAAEPLPAAPSPGEDLGMKCGGEASVFIDVVRPAPRLLIYGAGHVGERLANLAGEAGLTVVVVDDRPDFARRERFPRAAEVRCADLENDPSGGLSPGPEDFLVVLTRCHALDEAVLEAALRAPARYVGLIGSRRKVALILRSIARRLGRDPRADARLHAPIGLKLGDKSPGEIAISILAEILLVKSSGELAHNRLAPTHKGQRDHREEAETVQQAGGAPETRT